MQQLEAFYESTPKAVGFIERKITIPSHTLNLYGPPRSGKSWAVLDYLATIPKRKQIYIDLADLRVEKSSLAKEVQGFIDMHGIETVVIDHYDGSFPMPRSRQTILVTQAPYTENPMMPLLELPPLDFEEYLAFEKRPTHPEHSFSLYLRTGSLPAMAAVHESILTLRLHDHIRAIFPTDGERTLFRYASRFLGKPVTPNQLYTAMKREHRVSKDWLYKTIKSWEERRILRWLGKYGQPKAARRLLLYDFAMPASMYFEKSLMGQLYTIAARRLLRDRPDIAYTDLLDFYDPATKSAILLSPFANPQSAAAKVGGMIAEIDRLGVASVTILTISNSFAFHFDTMEVTAKPFFMWILEE
ncbi:ATP-binding protein [Hydrogenimonas urashimensis]|uniref:ATP-binding protein n=1 Tax=Hydrogenimonas urashimensis TaxID=2740515 RepID=UPI00191520B7|nr:ATP-binding protein [Hydrogenimonas urashimensis]